MSCIPFLFFFIRVRGVLGFEGGFLWSEAAENFGG